MGDPDPNLQPTRLPLWKACVDAMRDAGISYGQTYPVEFFEAQLRMERSNPSFSPLIHQIRRALEHDGFYLSGRGHRGRQFEVLPCSLNAERMRSVERLAAKALRRGVILGTNTRLDELSDSERRRHEGILERLAIKGVLMSQRRPELKVVPKLRKKSGEEAA